MSEDFHKMLFTIGIAHANGLGIDDLDALCTERPDIRTADDYCAAVDALIAIRKAQRS